MLKFILSFLICFCFNLIYSQVNPNNIDIVRGKYGTPHIFSKTDKEAAYGLAWAHAEDDFKTIQETFLPVKGFLGKYKGKEGAQLDYVIQLLKCKETVEMQFKNLSSEVVEVIEGYVEGLNAYALAHPNEVLVKKTFPITIKEYLTGYNLVIHFFSDTGDVLKDLFGNKVAPLKEVSLNTIGSNGFAFRREKTKDNKTYLNVNTHQPLEGPFAWYEAHMVSEQGWNMLGGLFPGSPFPFIGTNENLGWTHTYNYPDLIDLFQLEMHPRKKYQYKFDGQWVKLNKSKAKLKVKLKSGIVLPIRKKVLWSKYGPVVKNDSGSFTFRSNAFENISSIDQWYKMNKASNFNEFKAALEIIGVPRFNVIYADKNDNIFYLSNAKLPVRDTLFKWDELLPGNTSKTLTNSFHKLSDLPQLLNPSKGYLFNTNNSPFNCTHSEDNLLKENYSSTFSYRENLNNRSLRFEELIEQYDKISYEDFKRIKYDQQYPTPIFCPFEVNGVFELNPLNYPELASLINIIQKWDRRANVTSLGSTQWSVYYKHLKKSVKKLNLNEELPIEDSILIKSLTYTHEYLFKNFNKIEVLHGEFQKHVRGDVEIGVPGLVDMIAATSSRKHKDGMVKAVSGDSYIMLVRYGNETVEIETVLPYGISNRPDSPHYTDQMNLYVNQQRKKMTLDKAEIYKTANKIYHPK